VEVRPAARTCRRLRVWNRIAMGASLTGAALPDV
jgi:hypothetical protein